MKIIFFTLLSLLFVVSCSDEGSTSTNNKLHVFSDKKQALDKAKQVEQLLQASHENNKNAIEEQLK
ncbi:MAG: hypothetical protein QM479_02335 [Pseudomonadota bacterium]